MSISPPSAAHAPAAEPLSDQRPSPVAGKRAGRCTPQERVPDRRLAASEAVSPGPAAAAKTRAKGRPIANPGGVREADLVALADGSLPPERRAAVLAQVRRSPTLARALADQQRVVALVRSARVRAPAGLRRKVQAILESRTAGAEMATGDHVLRSERRASRAARGRSWNGRRPKEAGTDG